MSTSAQWFELGQETFLDDGFMPAEEIAVLIVYHERKVLVRRRPIGVPWGGYWEFPGGRVKSGESPHQAAVRECCEETTLEFPNPFFLTAVDQDAPHGRQRIFFYFVQAPADKVHLFREVLLPDDLAPEQLPQLLSIPDGTFFWMPIELLDKLRMPPANLRILPDLRAVMENAHRGSR